MVTVMSLRTRESEITFTELARFDGPSHIRCLRGELIGCGVHGDANLPCLVNWKTGKIQTLPPSPEADVSNYLVVFLFTVSLNCLNRAAVLPWRSEAIYVLWRAQTFCRSTRSSQRVPNSSRISGSITRLGASRSPRPLRRRYGIPRIHLHLPPFTCSSLRIAAYTCTA